MTTNEIFADATAYAADLIAERDRLNAPIVIFDADAYTNVILRDANTAERDEAAHEFAMSANELDGIEAALCATLALLVWPSITFDPNA